MNLLLWLPFLLPTSLAALVNVTIDNRYGDPQTGTQFAYSPNGAWFDGPGCSICKAQPDPTLAYDDTWIDSTFNPLLGGNAFPNTVLTASVNFTGAFPCLPRAYFHLKYRFLGTAVYVFCITANGFPDSASDLTFFLDGVQVGTYLGAPDGSPTFDYNVLVYANESLHPGMHSFTLQNGVVNGSKSLVLFDYLTYS